MGWTKPPKAIQDKVTAANAQPTNPQQAAAVGTMVADAAHRVGAQQGGSSVIVNEPVPTTSPMAVATQQAAQANLVNATDQQVLDYINQYYTPAEVRLLQIPELRTAIIKTARLGYTPEQAMVEIEKTQWWQQRTESMRTYDTLSLTDPKEFQAQVDKKMADLMPNWNLYGVDGDINEMAKTALRLGYDDNQIRGLMADALQKESDTHGLDTGSKGAADAAELQRIARQEFLTPVPQGLAETWAIRGVRDGVDVTGEWRQYLSTIAGPRFGIDPGSGLTPGDMLAPVRQQIGTMLEINPDAIDLTDPKYSAILQVPTDKGGFRTMTANEAANWARQQPGWATTKNASDSASEIADGIARTFGAYA